MFHTDTISELNAAHAATFRRLAELETAMNRRFFAMSHAVECMMLAAATGEAMLMIGPPGTAKSRMVRTFCNLTGLVPDSESGHGGVDEGEATKEPKRYFEYLLTQFTEPSELFGFFDLGKLFAVEGKREMVRDSENMMQTAEVVFLDEVFNASSAILNSLLTFMNERKFHDRGRVHDTPLQLLFSATNHPPREEGLAAVYDRFVLRCRVENVSSEKGLKSPDLRNNLTDMIAAAWNETHAAPPSKVAETGFHEILPGLAAFRADVRRHTAEGRLRVDTASPLFSSLAHVVYNVRRRELSEMSNRRLVKLVGVVLGKALLRAGRKGEGAVEVLPSDLSVILDYGLDRVDEDLVAKLRAELAEGR